MRPPFPTPSPQSFYPALAGFLDILAHKFPNMFNLLTRVGNTLLHLVHMSTPKCCHTVPFRGKGGSAPCRTSSLGRVHLPLCNCTGVAGPPSRTSSGVSRPSQLMSALLMSGHLEATWRPPGEATWHTWRRAHLARLAKSLPGALFSYMET